MRPQLLRFLFVVLFGFCAAAVGVGQQKVSSIVVRDNTSQANGGERATAGLRSQLEAALNREKPCVETMDDQDIRDEIQDERERALLEGGDSQ